jgi:endonuclease YncB( thermonuclease family)
MLDSRLMPFISLLLLGAVRSAAAADDVAQRVEGPVEASLVRVVDGDTLLVDAQPWPAQRIRVYVRLRGIDAPELHSRCADERSAARLARTALAELVEHTETVQLTRISGDKYYGRVLAEVRTPTGDDLSTLLLSRNLVRPYSGGRRHAPACG